MLQSVSMDSVAVQGQQLGQLGLAHIAAHHPDVQFVFHSSTSEDRLKGGGFLSYPMRTAGPRCGGNENGEKRWKMERA